MMSRIGTLHRTPSVDMAPPQLYYCNNIALKKWFGEELGVFRRIGVPSCQETLSWAIESKRDMAIRGAVPYLKNGSMDVLKVAVNATKHRLDTASDPETQARLQQRVKDISSIQSYFSTHTDVEFLGVYGWGEQCQISANPGEGISQYDSIVYRKEGQIIVEKIGSCWQLFTLLETSRRTPKLSITESITAGGQSIPFTLNDHCKEAAETSTQLPPPQRRKPRRLIKPPPADSEFLFCQPVGQVPKQIKVMKKKESDCACCPPLSTERDALLSDHEFHKDRLQINTQEGCPCCVNGLDLDELAGVGKETQSINSSTHDPFRFSMVEIDAGWGIASGISAPFAIIGLTAAYRNIVGSYKSRPIIIQKLAEMERLIDENDTHQLRAFRYCLQYSLFDATWNLCVPGAINGTSSATVLSTLIVSSPLSLPALATYATAQTARSWYDFYRVLGPETDSSKVNQIARSKRRFYSANATGFSGVVIGAVLVGVSPLTFGGTLIPGLVILIPATLGTGITNNIWPRKFRPRNGDLGISRDTLTETQCLHLIEKIRTQKTAIKEFKAQYMPVTSGITLKRFGAKLMSALPFCMERGAQLLHTHSRSHFLKSEARISMHIHELKAQLELPSDREFSDEYLLTQHLKELRYRQYGLNDFYWALRNTRVA